MMDTTPTMPTAGGSSSAKKRKRLTPNERSQRDQEREEKRQKLEEEKQKRDQEKAEKQQLKEQEKLKRDEEKRKKDEEKKLKEEERLRKLEQLKQQKDEEKQKREEEKQRREEEKQRREEEKQRKEEEKERDKQRRELEKKRKEEEKEREKQKKEEERRKKEEDKEKEKQKADEKRIKQAKVFSKFFQSSPVQKPKTISLVLDGCEENNDKENVESSEDDVIMFGSGGSVKSASASNSPDKQATRTPAGNEKKQTIFKAMPFQIKTGMAVAPLLRRPRLTQSEKQFVINCLHKETKVDGTDVPMQDVSTDNNYLQELKSGPRKCERTEVKTEAEVQVLTSKIIENPKEAGLIKWRMKLLQFHDNHRPAYWGTWKKRPQKVTARRPQAQETDLDYEFDSDDEWEDEPEDAEDIGSDKDDEKEDQDQPGGEPVYDDDQEEGWMVPHGYVSDSERQDEQEGANIEYLKSKEKEYFNKLKEQTKVRVPMIETEGLSSYSTLFYPEVVKKEKIRRSRRKRPEPSIFPPRRGTGFLAVDLPSEDEDDTDWVDTENSSDSDSDGPPLSIEIDEDDRLSEVSMHSESDSDV